MTTSTETADATYEPSPAWGRGAMQGALALSWSTAVIHGLGVVRTALLARCLVPELFGIVAFAESLLATLRQLQDFNFDTGLLYRRTRLAQTIYANLVLKGVFSVFTFLLIGLMHNWLNRWYDPQVGWVLVWFAAGSIIQTCGSTPRVLLERELRFTDMVAVQLVSAVVRTVVPVAMALAGMGLASLMAASLIDMVLPAIGFWWRRPVQLAARPSREDFAWFFRFSGPLWMAGGLTIICYAGSQVVVGSVLGSPTLGLYTLAFMFAGLPVQFISHAVSRAAFPTYAHFQSQPAIVQRLLTLVLGLLAWILCPLATLAAVLAPEMILAVLGERWLEAVPLFQSLCLYTVLRGVQDHAIVLWNAHGRTLWYRNVMVWEGMLLLCAAPWLVLWHGALGMSWAINVMLLGGLPYVWHYVRRITPVVLWPLVRTPLLVSGVVGLAALATHAGLAAWPVVPRLAAECLAGIIAGTVMAATVGHRQLTALSQHLGSLWRGDWRAEAVA